MPLGIPGGSDWAAEKGDGLMQHNSKPWLSLSSLIILILVFANTGLAFANLQATRSNALRTLAVIPAQDVMQLSKPDQYYGLSEASRKKCKPQRCRFRFPS